MRYHDTPLSGWGNFERAVCRTYRPEKMRQPAALLQDPAVTSLISRGLGRSYGDAAVNEAAVLLHTRLNRMIDFDPDTGVLSCEAGVSLGEIIEVFLPRGYFPFVTPGTRFVTVGGAIAADVHGKNHHRDGCFSECVLSFDLLTASGETLTCSREANSDVFRATIGGMGLTGIITEARIRLAATPSAYINVTYERAADLDDALARFDADDDKHHYSVAWIDCLASGKALGRSVLMRGEHAAVDDLPRAKQAAPYTLRREKRRAVPRLFPACALNSFSVRAFNALYYRGHGDARRIVDYRSFFHPLDAIDHWNRMYGRRGFVQYQALFPRETSRDGLVQLLERLAQSKRASFLAVLKSTGEQNDGLLSFPKRGHTLALDLPNRAHLRELLDELDDIVVNLGGRLYLAKDACLSAHNFAMMYPRLDEFRQVKARIDPNNRFASAQSRRLGIVP